MHAWLNHFLSIHTRSSQPDGRPLYAYRCRDKDYAEFNKQVITTFPHNTARALPEFTAVFCLYAAETWRRHYVSGPWAWELVFSALEQTMPPHAHLSHWVEMGLAWWRRPLLKSQAGHREFLLTLACEGGLPLRVLERDDTHLTQYFRALLEQLHQPLMGDPSAVAALLAQRYLPAALRQDLVLELSVRLVQAVIGLSSEMGSSDDPIAALDARAANWRYKLPLTLEDSVAKRLFSGLARHAQALTQVAQARLRWQVLRDVQTNELVRRLSLPPRLAAAQLPGKPPLRLHLWRGAGAQRVRVALLTRMTTDDYRCEVLAAEALSVRGKVAIEAVHLELLGEGYAEALPVGGGEALGPLPWVFACSGAEWVYQGEGTLRVRVAQVQVLAPNEGVWQGTTMALGAALDRTWYQVEGEALWTHPDWGQITVRCGRTEACEETLTLTGAVLDWALDAETVYHGVPRAVAIDAEGRRRYPSEGRLQWRPVEVPDTGWRDVDAACWGEVWLRWRDHDGVRLRRRVRIAPATLALRLEQLAVQPEALGEWRLLGLNGLRVMPLTKGVQAQPSPEGMRLLCPSLPNQTGLQIRLEGLPGCRLTLNLPLPRVIAIFVRDAQEILAETTPVAWDQLARLELWVRQPTGARNLDLVATIDALQLSQPLPKPNAAGWRKLRLAQWQERLAGLLAQTGRLDAELMLSLQERGGSVLARLKVAHYDAVLEVDHTLRQVHLPLTVLERLDVGWATRLQVYALPLWAPHTALRRLTPAASATAWEVPADLTPGPWWMLGYDGDWARFRPLLWVELGETAASDSALINAVLCGDYETRQARLDVVLTALGQDPNHPDWSLLLDYLPLLRDYPVTALDLFQRLPHHPQVLVLLLLKADEREFDAVWALAEELPFLWHTLPLTAWRAALTAHFQALGAALVSAGLDSRLALVQLTQFRQRAGQRQAFIKLLCDGVQRTQFPDQPLVDSELEWCRRFPNRVEDQLEIEQQALQARHEPDEPCPPLPEIRRRAATLSAKLRAVAYLQGVRIAPWIAVDACGRGQVPPQWVWEFRLTRLFDAEWFDAAFAQVLALRLAQELRR